MGFQQSAATPQFARRRAHPPCRHFKNQSCCCLGSGFRGGGFPTRTQSGQGSDCQQQEGLSAPQPRSQDLSGELTRHTRIRLGIHVLLFAAILLTTLLHENELGSHALHGALPERRLFGSEATSQVSVKSSA